MAKMRIKLAAGAEGGDTRTRRAFLVRDDGQQSPVLLRRLGRDEPLQLADPKRWRDDAAVLSGFRHHSAQRVLGPTTLDGAPALVYLGDGGRDVRAILEAPSPTGAAVSLRLAAELVLPVARLAHALAEQADAPARVYHPGPTVDDLVLTPRGDVGVLGLRVHRPSDPPPGGPVGTVPPEGDLGPARAAFGVCALLAEILTGGRLPKPLDPMSWSGIQDAVLTQAIERGGRLPPMLMALLQDGLAWDPSARIDTGSIVRALEGAVVRLPGAGLALALRADAAGPGGLEDDDVELTTIAPPLDHPGVPRVDPTPPAWVSASLDAAAEADASAPPLSRQATEERPRPGGTPSPDPGASFVGAGRSGPTLLPEPTAGAPSEAGWAGGGGSEGLTREETAERPTTLGPAPGAWDLPREETADRPTTLEPMGLPREPTADRPTTLAPPPRRAEPSLGSPASLDLSREVLRPAGLAGLGISPAEEGGGGDASVQMGEDRPGSLGEGGGLRIVAACLAVAMILVAVWWLAAPGADPDRIPEEQVAAPAAPPPAVEEAPAVGAAPAVAAPVAPTTQAAPIPPQAGPTPPQAAPTLQATPTPPQAAPSPSPPPAARSGKAAKAARVGTSQRASKAPKAARPPKDDAALPAATGASAPPTPPAPAAPAAPTAEPVAPAPTAAAGAAPPPVEAPAPPMPTHRVEFRSEDPTVTSLEVRCADGLVAGGRSLIIPDALEGPCRVVGKTGDISRLAMVRITGPAVFRCFEDGQSICR